MSTLSAIVKMIISGQLTDSSGSIDITGTINAREDVTLTAPTKLFHKLDTIPQPGSVNYDMYSGELENPLHKSVSFTKIQTIYVKNTGESIMRIGGTNCINLFLDNDENFFNVPPGAQLCLVYDGGITVTELLCNLTIVGSQDDTFELLVIGQ